MGGYEFRNSFDRICRSGGFGPKENRDFTTDRTTQYNKHREINKKHGNLNRERWKELPIVVHNDLTIIVDFN